MTSHINVDFCEEQTQAGIHFPVNEQQACDWWVSPARESRHAGRWDHCTVLTMCRADLFKLSSH